MNEYSVDRATKPGDRELTLWSIKNWIEERGENPLAGVIFVAIEPDHDHCTLFLSGSEAELEDFVIDLLHGK